MSMFKIFWHETHDRKPSVQNKKIERTTIVQLSLMINSIAINILSEKGQIHKNKQISIISCATRTKKHRCNPWRTPACLNFRALESSNTVYYSIMSQHEFLYSVRNIWNNKRIKNRRENQAQNGKQQKTENSKVCDTRKRATQVTQTKEHH